MYLERYASEEIKIKSHLFDEIFNNGLWSLNNCLNILHLQELSLRDSLFCQKALLLIDRFPGKVRPKDECLSSYPTTQNPSSYEQQHWTKVYSLIEVLFILLFMNRAWIRIHQRFVQLFPGVCLIRRYYILKKESKIKRTKAIEW